MRQKMLLLGAVLFGFLAFVLSYMQLQAERQRIMGASQKIYLIRATRNLVAGQEIGEGDIARDEVQRVIRPGQVTRELDWSQSSMVVGRRLETSILAGHHIMSSDLKPMTQQHGLTGIIRDGMRAVSIPVDGTGAVSNLVQPNDGVDVIGTFRFPDLRGDSALDTVTLTLLQNVRVLAVGNRWGQTGFDPSNTRGYSTVTLLLWPNEVEMIVFASQKGRLSLSLRNYEDTRIDRSIESRSVNFRELEKAIPAYNERRSKRQSGL